MAEQLADGNVAIALLGNTIATGAILVVLITILGPLSGAHFNPAVSFALPCAVKSRRKLPHYMRPGKLLVACAERFWRI
jgi:glycerol uptake facilitator-like aquaporin